jgi:hypothetical protein
MNRTQKGEGFPGQQIVVLPKWVVVNALQQPLLRELLPSRRRHGRRHPTYAPIVAPEGLELHQRDVTIEEPHVDRAWQNCARRKEIFLRRS